MSKSDSIAATPSWLGPERIKLFEMLWGCAISQALHIFAELDLAEVLKNGPMSGSEVAAATSSDAWTLEAVLRALAAFEVLREDAQGRYALTELGSLLSKSAAYTLWHQAKRLGQTLYQPLSALMQAVKTGQIAFDSVHGTTFYEFLGKDPSLAQGFHDTMRQLSQFRYANLPSAYDFSAVRTFVDVGGGEGNLTLLLLKRFDHLRAILLDAPETVARARQRFEAEGLLARCQLMAGDFYESVPAGGDAYIIANVLNNFRDDRAGRVLRNCRSAIGPQGRLLVLESLYVPGAPLPRRRGLIGVAVMAQRGGRSRSEAEWRPLLASAGFRLLATKDLDSPEWTSIIEASPA